MSKITSELADTAAIDNRKTPLVVEESDDSPIVKIMAEVEKRLPKGKPPMISTRASIPKNVLDAKAAQVCYLCKEPVWVSPSSMDMVEKDLVTPICIECVIAANPHLSELEVKRTFLESLLKSLQKETINVQNNSLSEENES